MAFQVKAFFFERYGGGGMDIIVREAAASNGQVIGDVVLDGDKVAELFEYLGINTAPPTVDDNAEELAKVEGERNTLFSENEVLKAQIENLTTPQPADPKDPVSPPKSGETATEYTERILK